MQYFDIEKKSGKVFLKQGLCATTSSQFQFSVIAKDNGSPPLTGESMVTIQIIRNSQPPVFLNTPYRSAITRAVQDNSALPGVSVATTDADTVSPFNVVSVTVIGDDSAVSLFRLDGSNIRVQNAANLAADTANTYK
ncbi:protocadherin-11 Y-linked-like, partial [Saccostrea cucullata]|uniref:protocadherin-11 Y-linked-like n=1 Tax=Saccostrea cuccullata TaxID=36930 RepID=UPI002ED0BD56